MTVVNTDEEPATKSAAKTPTLVTKLANTAPVAKDPALRKESKKSKS